MHLQFVGVALDQVAERVVVAEDLDSALALAKDCPVLRVGGGVEVGPVMEAAGS